MIEYVKDIMDRPVCQRRSGERKNFLLRRKDRDVSNGIRQGAEINWFRFTYRLFYLTEGYCGSSGDTVIKKSTEVSRAYHFDGLEPGPYCLLMNDIYKMTTPLPMDITIENGQIKKQHIGYWDESGGENYDRNFMISPPEFDKFRGAFFNYSPVTCQARKLAPNTMITRLLNIFGQFPPMPKFCQQ